MLNSKTDLNKSEWIEIVFKNRNKSYGAYDLRKHSASDMVKALAITLFAVTAALGIAWLMRDKVTRVTVNTTKTVEVSTKPVYIVPNDHSGRSKAEAGDNAAARVHNLKHGHYATRGVTASHSATAVPVAPTVLASVQTTNNTDAGRLPEPIESDFITVKPAPVGGSPEWSKFLETNLRYPEAAKQQRISGKVWVSFVVERDGRLSNITIDQPAGHGFDEEAIRVLKLSPKWTPGQQDGQQVRVRYSLPVDFHIVVR